MRGTTLGLVSLSGGFVRLEGPNPYVRSHGSAYYLPSSGISAITLFVAASMMWTESPALLV